MKFSLSSLWQRLAELFVGFFFITSAYLKTTESFFGLHSVPLSTAWNYWMNQGWTLSWYKPILQFFLPYEQSVAILVILAHGLFGLSLLLQAYRKPAALLFLFIQINLLFATFFGWGFLVMVFASLWMGVYYYTSTSDRKKYWPLFTAGVIFFQALLILGRINHGDFLLSSFAPQYEHFHREVMSAHVIIKDIVAWCTSLPMGPFLWVLPAWVQLIAFTLLFTRARFIGASITIIILTCRALIWTNVMCAEAVVHILLWYIWMAEEMAEREQENRRTFRECVYDLLQKMKMYYSTSTVVQRYFSTPKPSKYYPLFFCVMSVLILITLVIPAPFGLQNYNQWGGMYDEHWCQIDASSRDPHAQSSSVLLQSSTEYAGFTNTRRVYSGPMNNERTCFEWAKSRCGKQSSNGKFTIQFIIVSLKGRTFFDEQNICTMIDPSVFPWFGRA